MKRWIWNILAAFSLFLCLATAALWARSYWVGDTIIQSHSRRMQSVSCLAGGIWVTDYYSLSLRSDGSLVFLPRSGYQSWKPASAKEVAASMKSGGATIRQFGGFYYVSGAVLMGDMSAMLRAIYVPFWFIVSILAIGPTLKFLAIRKARIITWRKQNNRCPTCGYDLRATKDRCPECGSPITAIVAK